MNPIRKPTRAGDTQMYDFGIDVKRFLVKNLSGGDVTIGFSPDVEEAENWLVPDGAWQIIPGADNNVYRQKVYVLAITTSATARGVEIEAIDYRLPRGKGHD